MRAKVIIEFEGKVERTITFRSVKRAEEFLRNMKVVTDNFVTRLITGY